MNDVKILLVDDHTLVRAGLRSLLSDLDGITVIGEADCGEKATQLSATLQPDVILMDIAMKGITGLQALERIHLLQPAMKVILLSMHGNEEHVIRAIQLGACGYVLKGDAPEEIELAIHTVMRGETWFSRELPRQVIDDYITRVNGALKDILLTPRQEEVLKYIAEGASTKEIAFQLGISTKTVETYRAQLMTRLGIQDVAGLVRYALRRGISIL